MIEAALSGGLLGLASSLHCVGMCGGFAFAIGAGRGGRRPLTGLVQYHLGRTFTYVFLGVLVSSLLDPLRLSGWQSSIGYLAGGLLILTGLVQLTQTVRGPRIDALLWTWTSALRSLSRWAKGGSAFLFGVVNGFLPCGAVVAALACTAALNTSESALLMMTFGLGTAPLLSAIGLFGSRPAFQARIGFAQLASWIVLGIGVWTVWRTATTPAASCCTGT